jgi:hypothetical protein
MVGMDIDTPEGMRAAVAWTRGLLNSIVEGGVWYVPRGASSYTVSHANKTLTRRGMKSDRAINRVVEAMGWRVIENNPPAKAKP